MVAESVPWLEFLQKIIVASFAGHAPLLSHVKRATRHNSARHASSAWPRCRVSRQEVGAKVHLLCHKSLVIDVRFSLQNLQGPLKKRKVHKRPGLSLSIELPAQHVNTRIKISISNLHWAYLTLVFNNNPLTSKWRHHSFVSQPSLPWHAPCQSTNLRSTHWEPWTLSWSVVAVHLDVLAILLSTTFAPTAAFVRPLAAIPRLRCAKTSMMLSVVVDFALVDTRIRFSSYWGGYLGRAGRRCRLNPCPWRLVIVLLASFCNSVAETFELRKRPSMGIMSGNERTSQQSFLPRILYGSRLLLESDSLRFSSPLGCTPETSCSPLSIPTTFDSHFATEPNSIKLSNPSGKS
jgi:hypothetical protein